MYKIGNALEWLIFLSIVTLPISWRLFVLVKNAERITEKHHADDD